MDDDSRPDRKTRALAHLTEFFAGHRFAAVAIWLLMGFALLIGLVLVVPEDAGTFGAFARDFKKWCLFSDSAAGESPIGLGLMMLSELVLFAAVVAFLWWSPLKRGWRERRRSLLRWSAGGALSALGLSVLLVTMAIPEPQQPTLAALRTDIPAPELALTDHSGAPARLSELEDRVVLVTAVYATCGYTCPMIMYQAKQALSGLTPAERADVTVLAITLDPEHDTPEVLTELATAQRLSLPTWRFLTGPPADVEATLDSWSFARRKNPETGEIDHANLFVLVDRRGRQAFRLSLSTEREAWLGEALKILLAEDRLSLTTAPTLAPEPR